MPRSVARSLWPTCRLYNISAEKYEPQYEFCCGLVPPSGVWITIRWFLWQTFLLIGLTELNNSSSHVFSITRVQVYVADFTIHMYAAHASRYMLRLCPSVRLWQAWRSIETAERTSSVQHAGYRRCLMTVCFVYFIRQALVNIYTGSSWVYFTATPSWLVSSRQFYFSVSVYFAHRAGAPRQESIKNSNGTILC